MVIHKYDITNGEADMPRGAKILSAGYQGTSLMVWAAGEENAHLERREFKIVPTGRPSELTYCTFINTVFNHGLVFHIYWY